MRISVSLRTALAALGAVIRRLFSPPAGARPAPLDGASLPGTMSSDPLSEPPAPAPAATLATTTLDAPAPPLRTAPPQPVAIAASEPQPAPRASAVETATASAPDRLLTPSPSLLTPSHAPTALAPAADPQREALEARRLKLKTQLAEFSARRAEMAERVAQFELAQYQALGAVVEECLRLRLRLMQLQAARSGGADDRAAEVAAEAEFQAYRSVCEEATARPELSDADQEELKRMYRTAAMACHPDRVEASRRDAAHGLFQRLQQAYRQGDLATLRTLQGEIAGSLGGGAEVATEDVGVLKNQVRQLQDQVADLILAIQTLQLDPNYRQAARQEEWEPFFAAVRARFEQECEDLRRRIRALGEAA